MYAINLDTGIPGLKRKSRDSIPSEIASGSGDPGIKNAKYSRTSKSGVSINGEMKNGDLEF